MDYLIDASVTGGSIFNPSERFSSAFKILEDVETSIDDLEASINSAIPDQPDICNMGDVINALKEIQTSLSSIASTLSSGVMGSLAGVSLDINGEIPSIPSELVEYLSTGIILKRYQILKLKMEKIKLSIEKFSVEQINKVFDWVLEGKGSLMTSPIDAALAALSSIATIINAIMNVLGMILTVLSNISILNVKSAGCMFFMTPKSMNSTDITIMNVNQSTTNNIPKPVDIAISEASMIVEKSNKDIIDKGTNTMKTAGASTAMSGFDPGSFPKLPKFDQEKIKTAINALLQVLMDADALPRYEKLSIINPRFMTFLVTGFEPAAFQTFGIPGQP